MGGVRVRNGRVGAILATLAMVFVALPVALLAAPASAQVSTPVKILPLGDSITLGVGDGRTCTGGPSGTTCRFAGYRLPLQNALAGAGRSYNFVGTKKSGPDSIDRDHESTGGHLIGQMYEPWNASKAGNPDIVLVHAGTNDIGDNDPSAPAATAPQRLRNLVSTILAHASVDHVIVAKVTPWVNFPNCAPAPLGDEADQRTRDFNAAIGPALSTLGSKVSIVDMYSVINKSTDLADCVHPNSGGYGKMATRWFNEIQRLLAPPPPTVPGAPTGVSAFAGDGQATVRFTAPNNGGSPITSFTVTSSPGGASATGGTSPITVPELTNGTPYQFSVRATNAVGTGPPSALSNSVTPSTDVFLSSLTPTKTGDGFYRRDRNGPNTGLIKIGGTTYPKGLGMKPAVTLVYQLGGAYSRFRSDIGVDDYCGSKGSVRFRVYLDGSTTTSYNSGTMTGASANQRVDLDVTGRSSLKLVYTRVSATSCEFGAWADAKLSTGSSPAPTVPGKPTSVSAIAGDQQARVTFTAPANDGGSPITGYAVTATPATGSAMSRLAAGSPYVFTGLTNGTAYTFTVLASNSVGPGPPSTPSNSVTPTAAPPPPPTGTTYLSSLPVSGSGKYFLDRAGNNTVPIRIGGVSYSRGIGMNPPVTLTYSLNGGYLRFLSDIGVDDGCGNAGSVRFKVFVDGAATPSYESGTMTGATATKRIDLDVTGRNTLTLVYERTGTVTCDYGAWADARLTS